MTATVQCGSPIFLVAEHSSESPLSLIAFLCCARATQTEVLHRGSTARRFEANSSLLRRDYLVPPLALLPPLSRADGHPVAEAAEEALAMTLVVPLPPGQAQAQPGLTLTPGEEHLGAHLQRPGEGAEQELVCDQLGT